MLYAAYGSNLHPMRLTHRLSGARPVGTGFLADWSMRFHKRSKDESGKCSILSGNDGVYFAIFEISRDEKLALDRIEGVGSGYDAVTLHVPSFGDCATYIAQASHVDDALRPYDWYRELVLAGARFHGFPEDYVARIASVPAIRDPLVERGAGQWELIKSIGASA